MNKFLLGFLTILLSGCASTVKYNFTEQLKPLTIENKVVFLDLEHLVPQSAKKIGTAKYGDTGFSTDCNFNTNLINARALARENGANIVKVIQKKTPDLWSLCYRISVDFYYLESDLSNIPQYTLQIN